MLGRVSEYYNENGSLSNKLNSLMQNYGVTDMMNNAVSNLNNNSEQNQETEQPASTITNLNPIQSSGIDLNSFTNNNNISGSINQVNALLNGNSTSISELLGTSSNNSNAGGGSLFDTLKDRTNNVTQNKSDEEAEIVSEIKLVEPYNPTDPIVVFDPTLEKTELVREYVGSELNEAADFVGDEPDSNNLEIDGVKIPIIQLNNSAVNFENIEEFKLKLTGFLPELELKIYDNDSIIQTTDVPGMNNLVTVILISQFEGTNKKISLDFYITDCVFNKDNTINYKGIMNLNTFRSKQNIQIGSGKLTTYEMLEQIAKDNNLGFAATKECQAINDKRYRQIYRENMQDFINEQLSFAGTGSDTVIDAWVDEFGYLVMVDFAWVMAYNVNPFQLTIKTVKGINTGSKAMEKLDSQVEETLRMITNISSMDTIDDLIFDVYVNKVDNSKVTENGTISKYYYLKSPCDGNLIEEAEGVIIEPSMDAAYDMQNYSSENVEFIGFEFTDDDDEENVPIVVQKKNIENYKASMCNKALVVEMPKANYLLQRGMLVSVDMEEQSEVAKVNMLDESDVVTKTEPDLVSHAGDSEALMQKQDESEELDLARKTLLYNDGFESMQNITGSGLYYIQDITFKYTRGEPEIRQVMTLIKKGAKTNLRNYTTSRKVKFNLEQE